MRMNNYYYHGLQNPNVLSSILEEGLKTREDLKKSSKDEFSSSKDFLEDQGTNALDVICVCSYHSLAYYLFCLPNITLVLKLNDISLDKGSIEGEYLVKNSIKKENIVAIGINSLELNHYHKETYQYLLNLKNNYKKMKKYNLPIIYLETGKEVEEKDLENQLSLYSKKKQLKILIEGTIFSGKKEVIRELKNKEFKIYNSMKDEKISLSEISKYMNQRETEIKNSQNSIFQDTILDYKKNYSKEEWKDLLKNLQLKEKDVINHYDIIIHLYSMVNKYRNIYGKDLPKPLKEIIKEDKKIHETYKDHPNYYPILSKDSIDEKLQEVFNIIEKII